MRVIAIAALSALLASCAPKAEAPAEPTAEELGQDAPGTDGPLGWVEADGAGETGVSWRAGPNAIGFSLHCAKATKEITIEAERPEEGVAPGSAGNFFAGAEAFAAQIWPVEGLLTVRMKLPVTPEILKALSEAQTARIAVGDSFTETGVDDKGALKNFADTCRLLVGDVPPPQVE
jgi:hypothetical protein